MDVKGESMPVRSKWIDRTGQSGWKEWNDMSGWNEQNARIDLNDRNVRNGRINRSDQVGTEWGSRPPGLGKAGCHALHAIRLSLCPDQNC